MTSEEGRQDKVVPLEQLSKTALLAHIYKDDARVALARAQLDAQLSIAKRGQILAFCSFALSITAACTLGIYDHDWLGGVLGGGSAVAVIGLFITGRHSSTASSQDVHPPVSGRSLESLPVGPEA